ncbi:iron ABC transporter permease [Leifsonia sp. F6_8S_P_1B]|uniref:Iron ABC transporter permease n=1 Tax=Leifsonia williamsii TaxID=3035919 RepID=A0ABT8KAA9_9MICO|nr:iron ABC transporter permease [Leifsonia williamsii]MDN4613741.1 iron ABC transporter permease [Leifsonia williamsii]
MTGAASASAAGRPPAVAAVTRARGRRVAVIAALAVLIVAVSLLSAAVGQFALGPAEILASLGRRLGLAPTTPDDLYADGALWNVRFPRIVLGLIVGAALGVAGALMQGVFANPLAEPAVVGVSAGAAVGACAAIVFGLQTFGAATVPAAAFVMGIVTTLLVYVLSRAQGRTRVLMLVLTGVAVNAVANAVIALFVFLADTASREQIMFWQLGSLNGANWSAVAVTLPLLIVGVIGASLLARRMDALALGDRSARHLGVPVERVRLLAILLVALLTAAAVSFAGIIAFVGLIIPHLLRLLIGPAHAALLPASALGGALLIGVADVVARTAVPFADLPIGMFTALVGGPVFFVLLRRTIATGERA